MLCNPRPVKLFLITCHRQSIMMVMTKIMTELSNLENYAQPFCNPPD